MDRDMGRVVSDRWRYDHDDSEDEPDVYDVDPYDTRALKFRASLPLSLPFQMRRPELPANAAARVNGATQAGRPPGQQRPAGAQPATAQRRQRQRQQQRQRLRCLQQLVGDPESG